MYEQRQRNSLLVLLLMPIFCFPFLVSRLSFFRNLMMIIRRFKNSLRYLQRKLRQYFRKAVMRGGTIGENAEDDLSVQPQSSR